MLPSLFSFSDPLIQRLSQLIYRCLEDLGSTKAALYLMDPATQAFDLVSHYGWPRTQPPPERLAPLDPLLVLVSREKRGFAVNDARNFRELEAFGLGAPNARYFISPIYDRGDWKGVLIQRDPSKGGNFHQEQHQAATQIICEEIVQALNGFHLPGRPTPAVELPPELHATRREEVAPIRVPAPPSGAMVQLEIPGPTVEGAALEEIKVSSSGEASVKSMP